MNYERLAATAERLIDENGETCLLVNFVLSATAKPWDGSGFAVESSTNIKAVFLPTTRENRETIAQRQDEQRKSGVRAYIRGAEMIRGDSKVTRASGEVLRVRNAKRFDPNGQSLLWEVEFES
ncbi:head tail joining protein [Caudoviricetes sp.]|nr:head tail joining protein [Caudoviricetes sp.]